MEGKPLVSVSLITYNQEKFIAQAVNGILNQDVNFKYELIIGDDCSTDGTRTILQEFKNTYPEIIKLILHSEKGEGIPGKKNFLSTIDASTGKYIALCDGDDYWTNPHKLQKQVDFLEANPGYAICFHAVNILEDGVERPSELNHSDKEETFSILDLAKDNLMHTPSVVFRNGLIDAFPKWFNASPVGDYVLHMLNARKGLIKYFPQVMAIYRKHNTGYWSGLERIKILDRWLTVLNFLIDEDFEDGVKHNLLMQRRKYAEEILLLLMNEKTWQHFLEKLAEFSKQDDSIAQKWLTEYYPQYIYRLNNKLEQLTNSGSFKFASSIQRLTRKIKR